MLNKSLSALVFCLIAYLIVGASSAWAVNSPSFPSCTNPSGTLNVSYDSGTHGIVGRTDTYTGSDKVYQTSSDTLTQCFCSTDKNTGIQTNWWKVGNLTETEIQGLRNDGWVLVPNGALWGLDESPYLAKNSDFSCNNGGGGSSSNSNNPAGAVLAAISEPGQVLGLAFTGDLKSIVSLVMGGVLLIVFGTILKKKVTK